PGRTEAQGDRLELCGEGANDVDPVIEEIDAPLARQHKRSRAGGWDEQTRSLPDQETFLLLIEQDAVGFLLARVAESDCPPRPHLANSERRPTVTQRHDQVGRAAAHDPQAGEAVGESYPAEVKNLPVGIPGLDIPAGEDVMKAAVRLEGQV